MQTALVSGAETSALPTSSNPGPSQPVLVDAQGLLVNVCLKSERGIALRAFRFAVNLGFFVCIGPPESPGIFRVGSVVAMEVTAPKFRAPLLHGRIEI
jgi:hypothetical protein